MYREIKKTILCGLFIVVTICSLSKSGQQSSNSLTIEAQPKITKGFPFVIKATVEGNLNFSYLSIFEEFLPIRAHLISKSNGKEFVVASYRLPLDAYGDPTPRINPYPTLTVPTGKKYTMLFDLWSLSPHLTTMTALADVPAGKYSIYIELASEEQPEEWWAVGYMVKQKSNTIDIELVEPTEQEKQYIKKVRDSVDLGNFKDGVSWSRILQFRKKIPTEGLASLSDISKEQISFHKLLADVNISDEKTHNKSIKDVNDAKLPKFFEPERQLLLLELKDNPAKEQANLIQKYPQMEGMVNRIDSEKKPFLYYKELELQWNIKVIRPNKPNEPNKPAEPNKPNRQN
jgi:hypothetical protein